MRPTSLCRAVALLLLPPLALHAQARPAARTEQADAEFIKAAESGAPSRISGQAAVARMEPDGKLTTIRQGSNGFTCLLFPDESNAPFCGDRSAVQWLAAAMSGQPRPPGGSPGVAYMGKGGMHYENAEGESVMKPGTGTKQVKEPPHWMLLLPLDPGTTGIPTKPNAGGTYIMFAGTPYAHLMVYQDPKMLKD